MNLIIVESPTKAKTLSRFLDGKFSVQATYGHIRDLPEKKMGVKIERESRGVEEYKIEPEYVQTKKQKERIGGIKKISASADQIYLATDPDREGEAIAWHVATLLQQSRRAGERESVRRIVFHEITQKAIEEALKHPREVDMQLVDAQQARRVLDRLVGYKLSPLLWKKVRKGLSAGRVQSVALRLIVEKEREIEAFKTEEYWDIAAKLQNAQGIILNTQLIKKNEKRIKIANQEEAGKIENELLSSSFIVDRVEKKEFKRTPPPPFTTSTLQQAGANRLGWSAKKTMQVAQSLYEEGFITYHRTDSTNIAAEAAVVCSSFIVDRFGREYALEKPRFYKTKSKVAQEAHEAIRPTRMELTSLPVDQFNRDQQKLYDLIWKRFVACQMAEVRGVSVRVSVSGDAGENKYGLEAKGETVNFDGWYKLEQETLRQAQGKAGEQETRLPEVKEGERLDLVEVLKEQKFTQPPARYNDASLIKALEEMGIGRPSTYAPTLSTIQERQYVEKEEKRFRPTPLGVAVNDFLVSEFPDIVDYKFTAGMEEKLDQIAAGGMKWQPVVGEFYGPFEKKLGEVTETAQRVKVEVETTGEKCPKCKEGDAIVRIGKFGRFLACSRYPDCDWRANYQNKTGQKCTKCQDGDVIIRRTRSGRTFFGCSNYPKCDFASWTKPK